MEFRVFIFLIQKFISRSSLTYKNIETLRKKNQLSGECLNGTYFCATDMILISEMSDKIIKAVLDEMLSHDEIPLEIFSVLGSQKCLFGRLIFSDSIYSTSLLKAYRILLWHTTNYY